MLSNADLLQVKEIVKLLNHSGKRADFAKVASELLKTDNPKFKPENWDGHPKFITMIEEYPTHFQIIVHDRTVKEIRLIINANVSHNSCVQPSRSVSFEDCLNERLNEELIGELVRDFKLAQDMRDLEIIKRYLKYTYHKANSDDKVLVHGEERMLHTGWFYNGTDPIYCVWGTGTNGLNAFKFIRHGERDGRALRSKFNNQVPEQLSFPRMQFNPDLSIESEFGHIFGDRINRIPDVVKRMIYAASEIPFDDSISTDSVISDEYHNYLCRILLGCLEETRLRIRNNTEVAVPFWNMRRETINWLFPLRMGVSNEVNLVAILEPTTLNGSEIYRAYTVLGLKDAYINARVLGPVTAEWLKDAWH